MKKSEFLKDLWLWNWKKYSKRFMSNENNEAVVFNHVLTIGIKKYNVLFIEQNNPNHLSDDVLDNNFSVLVPSDFDWQFYILHYKDLCHMDENMAKRHYIYFGNKEGRTYNKKYRPINYKKEENILSIKVIKDQPHFIKDSSHLWAHFHCYDINRFDEYYGEYIEKVAKYFKIIVTYCIGSVIPEYNLIILKINNCGMDVGGKVCCIKYLNRNNIKYDFMLMMHSKTDKKRRKEYFDDIIPYLDSIIPNLDSTVGIYTHKRIRVGFYIADLNNLSIKHDWDDNNKYHMHKLINDYNLPDFKCYFPEGNVYILNSDVANYIYDGEVELYGRLNQGNSFDYPWFISYHNMPNLSYEEALKRYYEDKLFGNHIPASEFGNIGLGDCMVEHAIERIPFGVCKKLGKKIHIINSVHTDRFDSFINKDICKSEEQLDVYFKKIMGRKIVDYRIKSSENRKDNYRYCL